jgi:hypothetical protein
MLSLVPIFVLRGRLTLGLGSGGGTLATLLRRALLALWSWVDLAAPRAMSLAVAGAIPAGPSPLAGGNVFALLSA